MFQNLQSFLRALEKAGELVRVRAEVDPVLEITEIVQRVQKQRGPALLFERVTGSSYPVAINLFGTDRRVELALGAHPREFGERLWRLMDAANPPRSASMFREAATIGRLLNMRTRRVASAPAQEVDESPDLASLPALQCWPGDAGRFLTFPLVVTSDPRTGKRNTGVYRMQILGPDRTAMHWQIEKGGAFHAARLGGQAAGRGALPVAVALGLDPASLIAAVAPLPEGMDELAFAGYLRGKPTAMSACRSIPTEAPAEAEFVLEGEVVLSETVPEGPFGDHLGHYSHPAPFPVFRIRRVTRRRRPVYLGIVVGKPPQEDRPLGDAVQEMLLPLLRLVRPEVCDLWAHYEAGYHSLAVASVGERHHKEAMKSALGLLGQGQMSLTKCLILVGEGVNPRDIRAVLRAIRDHWTAGDTLILPGVPFDTLDFTSMTLNVGSKMVVNATPGTGEARRGEPSGSPRAGLKAGPYDEAAIARAVDQAGGTEHVVWEDTVLVVKTKGSGRPLVENLVTRDLGPVTWVAAVSDDVDLRDPVSVLWGIFTRFDPARDVVFTRSEMRGAWPRYEGKMGIDATFKPGYPDPIVMTGEMIQKVDRRWGDYGIS